MKRKLENVDQLMRDAISDGTFPGGVLLVAEGDRVIFHRAYGVTHLETREPVSKATVFDLASLTKPLATTLAVMLLIQRNRLKLTTAIGDVLQPFSLSEKAGVTIRHLLRHRSGFPAYQPFFQMPDADPAICTVQERITALRSKLVDAPLINPTGSRTEYSDLGFMVLQWVVETVTRCRLDAFVQTEIYRPLGVSPLFFIDVTGGKAAGPLYRFAATEACLWRKRVVQGAVHDENAFFMGGVAGHAGLFGTARAVHALLAALLAAYQGDAGSAVFEKTVVRAFLAAPDDDERAMGFDRPSAVNSSSGDLFSRLSVGHLGYTGTSFWMDLKKNVIIVLLTNRVHPTRKNERIKKFRPALHNAVMAHL